MGRHAAFKVHHQSDPSFLFSTWPIPEYQNGIPVVVLEPSGDDDSYRMAQAVTRLAAVSGGRVQLTEGTYYADGDWWLSWSPPGRRNTGTPSPKWRLPE